MFLYFVPSDFFRLLLQFGSFHRFHFFIMKPCELFLLFQLFLPFLIFIFLKFIYQIYCRARFDSKNPTLVKIMIRNHCYHPVTGVVFSYRIALDHYHFDFELLSNFARWCNTSLFHHFGAVKVKASCIGQKCYSITFTADLLQPTTEMELWLVSCYFTFKQPAIGDTIGKFGYLYWYLCKELVE